MFYFKRPESEPSPETISRQQMAVFAKDRLVDGAVNPATPDQVKRFTDLVMESCTMFGLNERRYANRQVRTLREPARRLGRSYEKPFFIGYNPEDERYFDRTSYAIEESLVSAGPISSGTTAVKNNRLGAGVYKFKESVFVRAASSEAFVERVMAPVVALGGNHDLKAIKPASESEVEQAIEVVKTLWKHDIKLWDQEAAHYMGEWTADYYADCLNAVIMR